MTAYLKLKANIESNILPVQPTYRLQNYALDQFHPSQFEKSKLLYSRHSLGYVGLHEPVVEWNESVANRV